MYIHIYIWLYMHSRTHLHSILSSPSAAMACKLFNLSAAFTMPWDTSLWRGCLEWTMEHPTSKVTHVIEQYKSAICALWGSRVHIDFVSTIFSCAMFVAGSRVEHQVVDSSETDRNGAPWCQWCPVLVTIYHAGELSGSKPLGPWAPCPNPPWNEETHRNIGTSITTSKLRATLQ